MSNPAEVAHISLLAMGGTISTGPSPAGAIPALDASTIAADVQGSVDFAIKPRDIAKVSSRTVTPYDMWRLAKIIQEEIVGGAAGVVITHGTDTLEETAYALALLVDPTVPVVLTAAMRPPHTPGSDGLANLTSALLVAADPATSRYGPVVVHQDEVHVARWVTKMYGTRVAAFWSPAAGPVAHVVEERVRYLLGSPVGPDRLPRVAAPALRVEVIWAFTGADGLIVDAIADRVDGLVVAGTGGGHVPPPLAESLCRAARAGLPVVLASRCVGGGLLLHTYGGAGSETQLLADGLVSAGDLAPLKARLRLLFGLSAGLTARELFEG